LRKIDALLLQFLAKINNHFTEPLIIVVIVVSIVFSLFSLFVLMFFLFFFIFDKRLDSFTDEVVGITYN